VVPRYGGAPVRPPVLFEPPSPNRVPPQRPKALLVWVGEHPPLPLKARLSREAEPEVRAELESSPRSDLRRPSRGGWR
jgi:hypothetical protein